MKSKNENGHLAPADVCKRWKGKISKGTLANWRSAGHGPNYIKMGGVILYPKAEIEKFERKNLIKV